MENTEKKQMEIRNDALKLALTNLKNERNAINEQKMLTSAKDAKLLAPVMFSVPINANQTGRFRLPKDAKIKYVLIHTKDKRSFFPLFTDLEEAQKLAVQPGQSVQYIVRSLKDYETILNDEKNGTSGIALNPMSDNIVLPTELVHRMNRGEQIHAAARTQVPPMSAEVRYSEPNVYPTSLVNAVYDACGKMESVSRVWLKSMIANMTMSYALFVESDKNDQSVLDEIKRVAEEKSKGLPVNVMPITKQLLETVIKDAVPLYDKELDF